MSSVTDLIKIVFNGGEDWKKAQKELITQLSKIIPHIMEFLKENGSKLNGVQLGNIVLQIKDSALIPYMASLLNDKTCYKEDYYFREIAAYYLGLFEDEESFLALSQRLTEKPNDYTVIEVLGERKDKSSYDLLKNSLEKCLTGKVSDYKYRANMISYLGIALAKHKDQSAFKAIAIVFEKWDVYQKINISKSFSSAYGEGVEELFSKYLSKKSYPDKYMTIEVLKSLMLLGNQKAIDVLMTGLKREKLNSYTNLWDMEDADESELTLSFLSAVLGDMVFDFKTVTELKEWWQSNKVGFKSDVCYRNGKPVNINDYVIDIENQSENRFRLVSELRIITGENFGLNPFINPLYLDIDKTVPEIKKWYENNTNKYETGKVYKYGFLLS